MDMLNIPVNTVQIIPVNSVQSISEQSVQLFTGKHL